MEFKMAFIREDGSSDFLCRIDSRRVRFIPDHLIKGDPTLEPLVLSQKEAYRIGLHTLRDFEKALATPITQETAF